MAKTATKARQQKSLNTVRQKLSAAVVMLLISAILMVSTTYAWFTLSTAPEVTGITTNVGANGNLEIALLNDITFTSGAEDLGIQSKIGDSMSMQDVKKANETWGNLVDLDDASYGLDNIILNPARLNVAKDSTTDIGAALLLAPSYGTDGRVINVDKLTSQGAYSAAGKSFTYKDGAHGVTAIGVSSGITQRLNAYRTALAAVTTNTNAAQNAARRSLTQNENGQDLANILVAHVQDPNAKVEKKQAETLLSIIQTLQSANNYAGDAVMQAVLAYNLSAANTDEMTDEAVAALLTEFDGKTPANLAAMSVRKPAGLDAAIAQWESNNTKIGNSKTTLEALLANGSENYEWAEISPVVNGLIDRTKATIAGIENPSRDNLQDIINYFTANNRIDIVMNDGSGIYADIAVLVGNYKASGFKVHVEYNGFNADVPVSMGTKATTGPLVEAIEKGTAPDATTGGGTVTLSELYGYALDFGFRTNAAASNLLLQTAAANRVYQGAEDAAVLQGQGSYMQFSTKNAATFTIDEVRALMSAMRVAFVTPNNAGTGYTLLAIAAPDIKATTNEATGITSYVGGTQDGNSLKAELYLHEYSINDKGVMTLGEKMEEQSKAVLTALQQNVAKKVTAVVYVDGDLVDNTMVANASTSMSGKLNLQFSSDATLKPMENSSIKSAEATYTEIATAGSEYVYSGYTFTVNAGYTIYRGNDRKLYYANNDGAKVELTLANYTTALTRK